MICKDSGVSKKKTIILKKLHRKWDQHIGTFLGKDNKAV